MSARQPHPIVRGNYLSRAFVFLPLMPIFYLVFHAAGRTGTGVVAALLLWGLVWPQLAYQLARRSADPKAAEHRNLFVDSVWVGAWIASMHFSLWPSVMLLAAVNLANLNVGGPAVAWRGVVGLAIGIAACGWATGFAVDFSTPPWSTAASMAGILLTSSALGYLSFKQNRRFVDNRRLLQAQNQQIEAHSALLAKARDEADAASRAKSLFLANMSHELRTPLNAIIGYSELLLEEAQDGGADQAGMATDLQKIHSAGRHLLGLINGMLDLSRIDAGQMDLQLSEAPVRPLLDEVLASVQTLADHNGNRLALQAAELGLVHTDVPKLRQMLLNLLGNAAKFTRQGQVWLRAAREQRGGHDWLVFEVQDTGIGMSPDQLARLFQPFAQADESTTRAFGGTGLGLALTQRLARLLGGDISVRSQPGQGSSFTLRVPAAVDAHSRG